MAQAKTINLLLEDGTLSGLLLVEDTSWNGRLLSTPKESIGKLLQRVDVQQWGVYLLISEEKAYVGQTHDLKKRIKQHVKAKDWWESAILLTTKDDSLNRSDVDYLEAKLIERARKSGTLDVDNKDNGQTPKVDEFRTVALEHYLTEALLLLELIGVKVFNNKRKRSSAAKKKITTSVQVFSEKGSAVTNLTNSRNPLSRDLTKVTGTTFYVKMNGKKAEIEVKDVDTFILKKDSELQDLKPTSKKYAENDRIEQEKLGNLNQLKVTNNINFSTLNKVARFINGGNVNAWVFLKTADGRTIHDVSRI
jgi:hypothetical protein